MKGHITPVSCLMNRKITALYMLASNFWDIQINTLKKVCTQRVQTFLSHNNDRHLRRLRFLYWKLCTHYFLVENEMSRWLRTIHSWPGSTRCATRREGRAGWVRIVVVGQYKPKRVQTFLRVNAVRNAIIEWTKHMSGKTPCVVFIATAISHGAH